MKTEQDSFEQCKKELEESLGISALIPPAKPMNPYMRFFLERSSEERSKGRRDWKVITQQLTTEWNELPPAKREFYQKIYEVRLRERNALLDEYAALANKRKPLSAYSRFVKRRYAQYAKELKNSSSTEINKRIGEDWAKITLKEKRKLEDEYKRELNDQTLKIDNSDRIEEYANRLNRYHEQISEDKEKILKKYGLTKENRARLKRQDREQARRQKRAQRILELEQRRRQARESKLKAREAKRKQDQEEREAQKKLRAEQKQQEKERLKLERQQKRAEAAELKKKLKEEEKLKKASKLQASKEQAKEQKKKSVPKSKSKPKKAEVKKSQKSKKIKKVTPKKVKAAPVKEVKEASPKKPAPPAAKKGKEKTKAKPKVAAKGKSRRVKK